MRYINKQDIKKIITFFLFKLTYHKNNINAVTMFTEV
jgi:hypothetical protein